MKNSVSFFKLIQGLTGNGSKLVIDKYQRNYVWTKERALYLVKTIISAEENIFIGVFIFYTPNAMEVQIVDAQQRVVTIYITLKCLRDIMVENREVYDEIFARLNSPITVQHIERAYEDLIDDKYSGEFKLSFKKKSTEEDFDAVIRKGGHAKMKGSLIEKNYNAIKSYLLDCTPEDLCKAYLHLLNTVQCVSLECESQVEAYRTFASINGLGQKVEEKYSVVNLIYQHLGYADEKVCDIIEESDKNFISRFLFHKTKKWYRANQIVESFSKYIENKPARVVVNEVVSFYEYDKESEKYRDDNFLIPSGAMTIAINYFRSLNWTDEEVKKAAKYLSAVFFRMRMCIGINHSKEDNTADFLPKVKTPRDIEQFVNFDVIKGRLYYPDDDSFKDCFLARDFYTKSNMDLCKYVLLSINNEISDYERFNPNNISVEHIMPQKKGDKHPLLHTIANITLTDVSKNSSMGAKDFKEKKEILTHSVFAINQYFKDVDEWTDEEMVKHGEYMANIALKIWSIPE